VIVRHGETPWTLTGQHTGTTELELTSHGSQEARALAPLLASVLRGHEVVVLCSPRVRALQTARLALGGWCGEPQVEPLLAECDYGDFEGLTPAEIQARQPGWDIWRDGCPGGETVDDVAVRCSGFLARHAVGAPRAVVAVTHGHCSRVLAVTALGRPAADGAILHSSTASVGVIAARHGVPRLARWNATALLRD
jgi:probable phosphoglycerate mutase